MKRLEDAASKNPPYEGPIPPEVVAAKAEVDAGDVRTIHTILPECLIRVELEHEWAVDRWIAEAPGIPGAMVYGSTKSDALKKLLALVERVLGE